MQAHLKPFELEPPRPNDNDFAVERAPLWQVRAQSREQLVEIAIERLFVPTLNEDFVPVAKDERSKSVHFGSKIHPSPSGSSLTRLASIGRTGGFTWSCMRASYASVGRMRRP